MDKNLNLISPINQLGYGVVGWNIYKELLNQNYNVALFPMGNVQVDGGTDNKHADENVNLVQRGIDNHAFFDRGAPCVRIWHEHDMTLFAGNGPKVGFPIFELDTMDDRNRHHLEYLDCIFVASDWARDALLNNNFDNPIKVVPLGVDREIFNEEGAEEQKGERPYWAANHTIFLNFGKWEKRKGHDILIEAFNDAFDEDDDVMLWMGCHNPFIGEEGNNKWKTKYLDSELGSKIRIIERLPTQYDVARVMQSADCGVFPSRAEGWNLELLEMMSVGAHVIATDYSGHTQFADYLNCDLIEINNKEKAYDGIWFHGDGQWAKIGQQQKDQLIRYMRRVHKRKQDGELGPNEAGILTAKEFSWENSVNTLISNLKEL